MRACVALLCTLVAACSGLTVYQENLELPTSDIQVALNPIIITCSLSDMVAISAPIIRDAVYYLQRPDGSTTRLNITRPVYKFDPQDVNNEYNNIVVKHESIFKTIVPADSYKVFDLLPNSNLEKHTKDLNANDFLIGPLLEEDHGNWILSVYYEDPNGQLVEMYQVITISISVYVPSVPRFPLHNLGDTFEFSFAYAIPHLESCELRAPRTSFDRFYDRNMAVDMARCGYVIKNLTAEDQGFWSIVGVGRLVYETQVNLEIHKKHRNKTKNH